VKQESEGGERESESGKSESGKSESGKRKRQCLRLIYSVSSTTSSDPIYYYIL
jgi:hypothetical protein